MTDTERKLDLVRRILRWGLGLGVFTAGLDKFFDLLTQWEMYLSPLAERLLPVTPAILMRAVGVIEMAVGIAILTRWPRQGAQIAALWLLAIAANLIASGLFYDLAVRDVEIALGAFALAALSGWREARTAAAVPA